MGDISVIGFLKFGEQKNLERLIRDGEIYMNTIKYFKDFETKDIGDKYEGVIEIKNIPKGTLTLKIPDNPIILKNTSLQLRKDLKDHIGNIYSTYAISTLLLKRKDKHRIDKRMSQFGSHCVIIKDVLAFKDSITNKLEEYGISYADDLVRYKNFSKNDHKLSLFHKTHLLSYQKEHRIIAYTQNEGPLKFNIGCIEQYAEILPTRDVIKSLIVDFQMNNHIA